MADVGSAALLMSLIVVIYSTVAYILGLKQKNKRLIKSAENGVFANAVLVTVASIVLFYALITGNFSIKYVAQYTSRTLPIFYKISAFWAGKSGSLLLWYWLLSIYAAVVALSKKPEDADLKPYASLIMMAIAVFFAAMLNFSNNPFSELGFTPQNGQGLNPMLQNIGMVFHPITLYFGFVGFTVPFAYGISALYLKKTGTSWLKISRKWTLISWLFLSVGMISGGEWAYVELGWGGYWAWDPVENASLLPWLISTAFLHSAMIQERRDMFKIWNLILIIITFNLTIFGTFLTRSGVISSVHSFGQSSIGYYFLGLMAVTLFGSLALLIKRLSIFKSSNQITAFFSKEGTFLFNNVLMLIITFAVFFGTVYPKVSEFIMGVKVSLGQSFFNRISVPLGILLTVLMGICSLVAWRKPSLEKFKQRVLPSSAAGLITAIGLYTLAGFERIYPLLTFVVSVFVIVVIISEFYLGVKARMESTEEGIVTALGRMISKNRRRYGGYIVHLSIIIMIIGIAGSSAYKQQREVTVDKGDVIQFKNYEIKYDGLMVDQDSNKTVVYANLDVNKNGNRFTTLTPAKQFFNNWEEAITEVDFHRGAKEDLYVILAGWTESGKQAIFQVTANPLIAYLFYGIHLLIIGTVIAAWPNDRKRSIEFLQDIHSKS